MTQETKLALYGGIPVRGPEKSWPGWPQFDNTERQALNDVLESGKWWFGERVHAFEKDFAVFQDAAHCVTCNSGTAAAELVFQAIGLESGEEVIVPAYSFVATASSVARMGGVPVFVDVDDSWCMDPAAVEAAITSRTKMIVPVHFAGRVADLDRLHEIAVCHGLSLMEDACHSWGSKWKGKGTGAIGRCGVFSFQMSKNMTAGEGGAILSDDEELADRCRSFSNCGRLKGSAWYEHALMGTNARLTEFAGALLSAQLSRLEVQTLLRARNAAILDRGIAGVEGVTVQPGDERITRRAYHLYCLRLDAELFGCSREKFIEAAQAEGLPITAGYLTPLYRQPVFAEGFGGRYAGCSCPVVEELCAKSGMWLPHTVLLGSQNDMQDVIDIIHKIKANVGTF